MGGCARGLRRYRHTEAFALRRICQPTPAVATDQPD
jgi:hypothetical protein